ncbi:MAG: glycosyltransferase family 4 protein [Kiloniellaceae bacterium]
MRKLRVLTFTSVYPNAAQPGHGVYTERRLRNLLATGDIESRVVAPVPWVPAAMRGSRRYGPYYHVPVADRREGIDILYPRYPTVPKIGMTPAPFLMASALAGPLRKIARGAFDFDILDAFYFYPDGVAAAILGRLFDKPVVITAFGSDINLIPDHYWPRRMIRWAAGRAAGVTAVCEALKHRLVELGVPAQKIHVILHGVDLRLFVPPQDRARVQARLGMSRPTLLSVGSLIERKGHHIAIEAMADLPDFDLLIAGEGEMERTLRDQVAALGLGDRIRFLGHVNERDLPAYYGAADALVLPSSREGIANVLLESMACGTPVIATRVWGAPEVITVPEAGVMMPERTARALVDAVRALFADYPDRAATRRFVERFSWDDTAAQHLAVLQGVMARNGGCGL